MSLYKISRPMLNRMCKLNSCLRVYSNSCGGDKNKGAGSNDSVGDSGKHLTDPSMPCCPCDNPSAPTMYDCRKYGHSLPCDSVAPYFETLPYIPTGIFRCTYGEMLGRGASKCSYYQNPEYFSYHHMTFYDMHFILRPCRKPAPKTGRKP